MTFKNCLLAIVALFLVANLQAETVDVRFANSEIDGDKFSVVAQIRAADNDLKIGTATIFFSYNLEAISNPAFESIHFNNTYPCADNGNFAPYESSFNKLEINDRGEGNYAILLNSANNGCPTVNAEWIDVARFTFDLNDAGQALGLDIHANYTGFNTDLNDGSMHSKGVFTGLTEVTAMDAVATSTELASDVYSSMDLYPIPTTEAVNVEFTSTASTSEIVIYDILGKEVRTEERKTKNGMNNLRIDVSDFENGTYFLKLVTDGVSITRQFLVVE